jgi:hypothetical protein
MTAMHVTPQVGVGTKTYYAQAAVEFVGLTRTAVVLTINSCSIDVIKTADKNQI